MLSLRGDIMQPMKFKWSFGTDMEKCPKCITKIFRIVAEYY